MTATIRTRRFGRVSRNRRALIAAAAVALALSSCGQSVEESAESTTSEARSVVNEMPELLRFTAPLVGGGELDGASFAGRPVAFWFWAPT